MKTIAVKVSDEDHALILKLTNQYKNMSDVVRDFIVKGLSRPDIQELADKQDL